MKKMYCLVVTDDFSRFTWVFFLATKDETSGILKSFITRIENLVDHKVKVIRCDNRTEFKNKEMNQFCEMKEAVNTACYVQNRVLVVKPHNKTPYELFHGRTPTLSFMRPFGCPVTILNTIDHLGKFDGKADEGFFVGYSLNSKAFRVFNSRTRIVEENLHIRFSESTPNVVGSGPDWLFDINALTRTMNYEPIVVGTKASNNAGQARKEAEPVKNYILLPLWPADPPYSQDPKSSQDDESKPSSDDGKKVDENSRKDSEDIDQEKEDNVNSTNNVNAASINEVNIVGGKTSIKLPLDLNMPELVYYSIFDDDEDVGAEADMHNLDTTIQVSPIPTTRIHKDHPLDQVIGDLQSATQTRRMSKSLEEHWNNPKRATGTKWVFRNKKDERGIVIRNKARLVLKDLKIQTFLIEYTKLKKHCMDYIKLPRSGMKLGNISVGHELQKRENQQTLFIKKVKRETPMGELTFFLGLQVQQKKDGIFISQDKYVGEILKKFGFTEVKTASTPIETQKPMLKDEDGEEVDVYMYRSMIGSLMYLTSSRPVLLFAVWCQCKLPSPVKSKADKGNLQQRGCQLSCIVDYTIALQETDHWVTNVPQQKLNMCGCLKLLLDKCFGFRINYLIMGINLLLLVKVNAARHKLTTAGDG
ncbi:putative ribonuclease H-like domain-containing protein [Tanacetum coccineum]